MKNEASPLNEFASTQKEAHTPASKAITVSVSQRPEGLKSVVMGQLRNNFQTNEVGKSGSDKVVQKPFNMNKNYSPTGYRLVFDLQQGDMINRCK